MGALRPREVVLIALAALAISGARALWLVPVIEGDGAEYARIAENLVESGTYEGLLPGRERMLPPLYPVVVAGVISLTGWQAETSARLVSVLSQVALAVLLTLIAARVAGGRAARLAGALGCGLPAFVLAGSSTFCEALYLALVAGGLLTLLPIVTSRRLWPSAVAGVLLGLAYLTRVEVLAVAGGIAALLAIGPGSRGLGLGDRYLPAVVFLGMFLLTALPYPVYLHDVTGSWRFEGKSERVFATVERYANGLSYGEANYALGENGEIEGPWLEPNAPWEGPGSATVLGRSTGSILALWGRQLIEATWLIGTGHTVGSLLFLLLLLPAWRSGAGRPEARWLDLALIGICLLGIFSAAAYKIVLRYLLPVGLASVLWGARGLSALLARRASRLGRPAPGLAAIGVLVLLLSASRGFVTGLKELGEASGSHLGVRTIGWALVPGGPGAVMSSDPRVAWYASRTWIPLPVASDWATVSGHAGRSGVRFLVVEDPESIAGDDSGTRAPGPLPPPGWTLVASEGEWLAFVRD